MIDNGASIQGECIPWLYHRRKREDPFMRDEMRATVRPALLTLAPVIVTMPAQSLPAVGVGVAPALLTLAPVIVTTPAQSLPAVGVGVAPALLSRVPVIVTTPAQSLPSVGVGVAPALLSIVQVIFSTPAQAETMGVSVTPALLQKN